jgi:hypothetical protein
MGPPIANGRDAGFANVGGGVEIWFADLKMDNVSPLGFQRASANENFKRGFCPETLHSGRESHLTTFNAI